MDRRSWLWRRKSSETESSDDQYPELTSKASEETCDDKLSTALLTINAKDELVKQHAKVAEEAVSGWENAEKELVALKHQLEVATKKNSELEDRLGHLDAALKECMRQLRQAREDQEQKVDEALARKTTEWESIKSDLETKLIELQAQLQTAKSESAKTNDSHIQHKLEAVEKKNAALKLELLSQAEELEIRFMERELSIQAAETASKLHLESIKKVAKLEAECRRLKSIARRASPHNDNKSLTASSFYVESFTDSLSDSGERMLSAESDTLKIGALEISECEATCASALIAEHDQFKNQRTLGRRNIMVPSAEIDLMDDFLEMERLAALPDTESGSSHVDAGTLSYQENGGEMSWKADLETMIHRTAELEERLENIEEEKAEVQSALTECHKQLETSQIQLKQAEVKLIELQAELALANEAMKVKVEEIEGIKTMREKAETQLLISENEIKTLLSKVDLLGEEIFKERVLSAENLARCHELENELSKQKHEAHVLHDFKLKHVSRYDEEVKTKQEKELAVAASKFAECQKTIASLGRQLKSLAAMEDFPEFPINEMAATMIRFRRHSETEEASSDKASLSDGTELDETSEDRSESDKVPDSSLTEVGENEIAEENHEAPLRPEGDCEDSQMRNEKCEASDNFVNNGNVVANECVEAVVEKTPLKQRVLASKLQHHFQPTQFKVIPRPTEATPRKSSTEETGIESETLMSS